MIVRQENQSIVNGSEGDRCKLYYLVDPWKEQKIYKEAANVNNIEQEKRFKAAKAALAKHANRTKFLRMMGAP